VAIPDDLPTSPRGARAGVALIGAWACAFAYCSRNQTDGLLSLECIPMAIPLRGQCDSEGKPFTPESIASALVASGLAESRGDHLYFPDFLDYNRSAAERAALTENRRRAGRAGGVASGQTRGTSEASALAKSKPTVGGGGDPFTADPVLTFPGSTNTNTSSSNSEALASLRADAIGILDEAGFSDPESAFEEYGDARLLEAMSHFSHTQTNPDQLENLAGKFHAVLKRRVGKPLPNEAEIAATLEWWRGLVAFRRERGGVAA